MSDDTDIDERLRSRTEIRRWLAESDKFVAEQRKLMAEAAKFERERWTCRRLAVPSVILAIGAAVGAITGLILVLGKAFGWPT